MTGDRDAEVDPRFDPVFQRGYDPAVHGGRRARTTARHATGPTPIASMQQPLAPAAAPAPAATEPTAPEPVPAPPPAAEADLTLSTRNPFRLALLIASIASIGAAIVMVWNRIGVENYYNPFTDTDQFEMFRDELVGALPVPLLTGGLLGLILWLAIGAMAHRTRVESESGG